MAQGLFFPAMEALVEQVLAVCPQVSRADVVRDLSITGSPELTINRIFEGTVRKISLAVYVLVTALAQIYVTLQFGSDGGGVTSQHSPSPPAAVDPVFEVKVKARNLQA